MRRGSRADAGRGTAPAGADASVVTSMRRSLALIGPRARRRYILVVGAQMATSLLDLVGVLLIGMTVVLAYSVPAGMEMPATVTRAQELLGLEDVPTMTLAVWCGALAAIFLLAKSVASAFLLNRIFRFLSHRQAEVSARLARRWFAGDVHQIHSRPDTEVEQALTGSAYYATTGLLGSLAVALGELSLLVVLAAALLVIDPVATLLAAVCFALVSVLVHRALSGWASQIGTEVSERSISARTQVRQATESFRELRTSRRLGFPIGRFAADSLVVGQGQADLLFINNVPKIAYEAALVLGAAVLVGWRVASGDLSTALAFLAVFLTAAARLLPSMVRLQGQVVMVKGAAGQAWVTFDLADVDAHPELAAADVVLAADVPAAPSALIDFDPSVEVIRLTVRHPGVPEPTLVDVSLHVPGGESLVLVGVTGAGKSTLVDVLLGVAPPESGRVLLGGLPPQEAQARWPGAIAYMPQSSALWHGTVRENVCLGLPRDIMDDDAVWHALEQAHLAADVLEKGGLDFAVGPGGQRLSGGQRQRLGIARALYSQPRLLFLDEATSALDEQTEALIGSVLDELRGRVTVVAVAHRRATIERASQLAVIVDGTIGYQGTPQEYLAHREAHTPTPTPSR